MKFCCSGGSAIAFLALGVVLFLPACAGMGGEGAEPEGEETQRVDLTEKPVYLGNVTLVNEDSGFVLIKTPVNRRMDPGFPLQSFRDGELSAELLFSPEQSSGFMTADIREGAPGVGDQVFLRYTGDFDTSTSPRMKRAMEQFEREQNMSFFDKWKVKREERRRVREKKRMREE